MAEVFDTPTEAIETFDGSTTFDEAEYALRDFHSKDIAITAAQLGAAGGGGGGSDDQTAAEVPFSPAGGLSSTNVQDALEELDAASGGYPTFSGAHFRQNGGAYNNGDDLIFDEIQYDTDDYQDGDSTPTHIVPPANGYYLVTAFFYDSNGTTPGMNVKKNDTGSPIIIMTGQDTNGDADKSGGASTVVHLLTTDFLNVEYLTFDPGSAPTFTDLTITRLA